MRFEPRHNDAEGALPPEKIKFPTHDGFGDATDKEIRYDYLSVTFMNTSLFQIESTKIRIAKFYEITARIPQQLDNSRTFYSSN